MSAPTATATELEQRLLKPRSVALRFECSIANVYKLVRDGKLRARYLGNDMRIPEQAVVEFIASLPSEPPPMPVRPGRKKRVAREETAGA
jgi:excisionase family DNA binding protein